jgi:hypothetical protein
MTDVRDIGAIGARVLLDRASHAGKTYSFTGALTTVEQFVVVLSPALHRKITPIRDANYFHFLFYCSGVIATSRKRGCQSSGSLA